MFEPRALEVKMANVMRRVGVVGAMIGVAVLVMMSSTPSLHAAIGCSDVTTIQVATVSDDLPAAGMTLVAQTTSTTTNPTSKTGSGSTNTTDSAATSTTQSVSSASTTAAPAANTPSDQGCKKCPSGPCPKKCPNQ